VTFGQAMARLTANDAARFERRLKRLLDDFSAADTPVGVSHRLPLAFYETRDG